MKRRRITKFVVGRWVTEKNPLLPNAAFTHWMRNLYPFMHTTGESEIEAIYVLQVEASLI